VEPGAYAEPGQFTVRGAVEGTDLPAVATVVVEDVTPTDPPTDPTDPPVDPTDPPVDPTDPGVDPTDVPTDPTDPATDPSRGPGASPTSPPSGAGGLPVTGVGGALAVLALGLLLGGTALVVRRRVAG